MQTLMKNDKQSPKLDEQVLYGDQFQSRLGTPKGSPVQLQTSRSMSRHSTSPLAMDVCIPATEKVDTGLPTPLPRPCGNMQGPCSITEILPKNRIPDPRNNIQGGGTMARRRLDFDRIFENEEAYRASGRTSLARQTTQGTQSLHSRATRLLNGRAFANRGTRDRQIQDRRQNRWLSRQRLLGRTYPSVVGWLRRRANGDYRRNERMQTRIPPTPRRSVSFAPTIQRRYDTNARAYGRYDF